jgi:hypothetical protein
MRVLLLAFLIFTPIHAYGSRAEPRNYRWQPKEWKPLPYLISASFDRFVRGEQPKVPISVSLGELGRGQRMLRAGREFVGRGRQVFGPATIEGTWTQSVFQVDGRLVYGSGQIYDEPPPALARARVERLAGRLAESLAIAKREVESYRLASRRFSPELIYRPGPGKSWAYWQVEYVSQDEDRLLYVRVGDDGRIETGELPRSAAEGRALVYPAGPLESAVTEMPLYNLVGDGTLSGRRLRVSSALDLKVWAPDLRFFFPANDRRFDLSQVYFTMDEAFRWLSETLKVELRAPVEVRLHVGNNGVSNAAFYHQNTVYLGTGDGVIYRDMSRDPSVLVHEAMHAVIDAYSGLPSQGEGGALNEGFADLFTAIILQNPRLGEASYLQGPYRRTLEHDWKAEFTGSLYRDGSIIAATFWDFREFLSREKLADLAFRTLVRLGPGASLQDLLPALLSASTFLDQAEQEQVVEKLRARGWVMLP